MPVLVITIFFVCQKVFPLPTVGAPSASKSPSALSAQALRARLTTKNLRKKGSLKIATVPCIRPGCHGHHGRHGHGVVVVDRTGQAKLAFKLDFPGNFGLIMFPQ